MEVIIFNLITLCYTIQFGCSWTAKWSFLISARLLEKKKLLGYNIDSGDVSLNNQLGKGRPFSLDVLEVELKFSWLSIFLLKGFTEMG